LYQNPGGDICYCFEEWPKRKKENKMKKTKVIPPPQYDPADVALTKGKEDVVNHPSHYTAGGIEAIVYMEAKSTPEEFLGHLRLTALKYLSRAGKKDDMIQDMKKARWYLDRWITTAEKSVKKDS
jgi:hypothetical protein